MNQTGQVQAMPEINVICEQCGGEHHDPLNFICPECGSPLSIIYDYEQLSGSIDKESFKRKTTGVWRYKFLLPPISVKNQTSLGEGGTPLVACRNLGEELGLTKLYAKLECLNPTGSFKDRGSAVGVSFALENGFTSVGCTSSGNMAASVSAYGAKAALETIILVPSYAPKEKIIQICSYGAKIIGTGNMPSEKRQEVSHQLGREKGIFMINNNSPFRVEGQKTFSFEIWEDLDWEVPDWVVIPTSSGGNTYAIIKGFRELQTLGLIDKIPKILVAQSSGCAPIVRAFTNGKKEVDRWPHPDSVAKAILNPLPPSGKRILAALAEHGGIALETGNDEIIRAMRDLSTKEGIFCEPSSATSFAVLRRAVEEEKIGEDETVVLDITGIGFKDLEVVNSFYSPPIDLKEWTGGETSPT